MRSRIFWQVLLVLAIAVNAAALLSIAPRRATLEDFEQEMMALRADHALVDAGFFSETASDAWADCGEVAEDALRIKPKLQTQVGILFFSARVNLALAEGCAFTAPELQAEALLAAFDARIWRWQYPRFARWWMRADAAVPALRQSLQENRAAAECVSRQAAPIRAAASEPPRDVLSQIHQECRAGVMGSA